MSIDLADTVSIEASDSIDVQCHPEVTSSVKDNLVFKAATLLSKKLSTAQPLTAKITVEKSIPTGAGLGGGSSNAAVTLLGLFEFWKGRRATDQEIDNVLFPIALSLGSDIPFFLHSGVCYVTGRGEHVHPLQVALPWTILVVLPGIHVNTAWAYEQLQLNTSRELVGLDSLLSVAKGDATTLDQKFRNDFEPPVMEEYPVLNGIRADLVATGADCVMMSGTGSTMYAIFSNAEKAKNAQDQFTKWTTYICSPVSTQKPE